MELINASNIWFVKLLCLDCDVGLNVVEDRMCPQQQNIYLVGLLDGIFMKMCR